MPPIYLDYNATTPILPEVADAMQQAHERQRSGTTQTAEQQ